MNGNVRNNESIITHTATHLQILCDSNTLQTKSGGYEDSWRSSTLRELIKEVHMDGTYSAAEE